MKNEKKIKYNKGITLVALVITIIVLIILAGISINLVLGEDGIFKRAVEAREKTKEAQKNEQDMLNTVYDEMQDLGLKKPQLKYKLGEVWNETNNTTVYDEYNNPIVIPAGFHIVSKKEDPTVEYNYTKTENNIPSVQDGIVVEDSEGNQFVWIPVGTIYNKEGDPTTIQLQRCTFDTNGKPTNVTTNGNAINSFFTEEIKEEHQTSGRTNTIAKDIEAFKTSATKNGGYYLARYEASYDGEGTKPYSKPSTHASEKNPTQLGDLWNCITQPNAATKAENMYQSDDFTSDLVNSYAWDTALVFIQKYSDNSNYVNVRSKNNKDNGGLGNTGERKETTDKVCNIYDMASNCWEWSTETYTGTEADYVGRGGFANSTDPKADFTSYRSHHRSSLGDGAVSFRVTLYLN